MTRQMTLRVHYPAGGDRVVLRTDQDWDRDVTPSRVNANGITFEFDIEFRSLFHYFKPLLVRDGAAHWSLGENYLALQNGHASLDVYPYFFSPGGCSACVLHELQCPSTGRVHAARVFYPAGYEENTLERFPVVYMQDGQNLFFAGEAFGGHDWMIDETLNVLTAMNLVRRAIVVGVYPGDRMVDYTMDGYDAYRDFLIGVVKPWVDANYRTLRGAEDTAVMGSSLGGVVSLHIAWSRPDVFGYAGCLSSTFGYRDDLARRVASEKRPAIRIYLDSGWPRDNYEVTRNMRDLLVERGYVEGKDLMYLAFPRATHNEQAWAMRAHIPFQHFFKA